MRRLIRRAEGVAVVIYEFTCNTWYYLGRGHRLMDAISLARITLPK